MDKTDLLVGLDIGTTSVKAVVADTASNEMQIIGEIRYCDAKSKGVGNPSLEDGDLLRELVYKILH